MVAELKKKYSTICSRPQYVFLSVQAHPLSVIETKSNRRARSNRVMTAEMSTLPSAAAEAGEGCAVILSVGALGARAPSLLNAALGTTLPIPASEPRSSKDPPATAPATALVAVAAPGDAGVLVLNVQGLDSRNRAVAAAVDGALHIALSIAGVVVLAIRLPDLARSSASGVDAFFSALEKNLHHRVSGVASRIPMKRMIVVAVRDFEVEEVTEEELQDCILQQFEAGYGRILKPEAYARKNFEDLFEVRFCLFSNDKVHPAKFEDRVKELGTLLGEESVKAFADAGNTPDGIVACAEMTAESMNVEVGRNLPADRELAATFACNTVMQGVIEKFRRTTNQWKVTVDSGRIIRDFGAESGKLISRTIEVYENDCAAYADTKAFARKKDELKNLLLADAHVLYAKQILKLREVAYQIFRGNLGRIRINDHVDKSIKKAVRQAELYFIEKAESLRCTLGNWRFENERHELVNHMREDATERLQLARLQGNYVPPIRAPVAFAFHTLLSAPFGQDSRNVHPHAEEMQQKFDPDKVKKAGLMRSRPYPTKHIFRMGPREAIPKGAMDIFDDLFVNAEK